MSVLGLGMMSAVANAQLAAPHQSVDPGSTQSKQLSGRASEDLVRSNPADALRMADQAIAADTANPWGHYDRGAALTDLGRTDEAVASFQSAQQLFSTADAWGKSISMYGQANALAQAGRCAEATTAYEAYARYVEQADPSSAALARRYATNCVGRR
jgi:hypothetical protein